MAEPAIAALTRIGAVVVAAPAWGAVLYRGLPVQVVPRGQVDDADVAVLFAPSFRAAWEARGIPRRVGIRGDGRGWLLTDAVDRQVEHRAQGYARIVQVLGAQVDRPPRFAPTELEQSQATAPKGHLALAPVSPSGDPVMWQGFQDLGAAWTGPVRVYTGPGEHWPTELPVAPALPLGPLAAELQRAGVLVANDSGLSHFGRALGVPTVVVHGSTAPEQTGALGSTPVSGPSVPCHPCYAKSCRVGGVPCLEIPVSQVAAAARSLL
jgi:ADP-heptose:LPS heptosyltransferase